MSRATVAASANTFQQMFHSLRQNFALAKSDEVDRGSFSAGYEAALHLEKGAIASSPGNYVEVTGLDVVWDTLTCGLWLEMPGICVGGWSAGPDSLDRCGAPLPRLCTGGAIRSEADLSGRGSGISGVRANLAAKYYIDPARTAGETDRDAEFNGHPNKWRIFLNPLWVHADPIEIPASMDGMVESLLKRAIDERLELLPRWARDLMWALIGPVMDLFKSLTGISGSVSRWFSNLLGNEFHLLESIETAVADYFANRNPIYEFEDPYPILAGSGGPIPVKIPMRDPALGMDSSGMMVGAHAGT